jgi:hypothetical protein
MSLVAAILLSRRRVSAVRFWLDRDAAAFDQQS